MALITNENINEQYKITFESFFQVDGRSLPKKRFKLFNGELTLENLRKTDHGVYECVVKNDVATIVARYWDTSKILSH